MKKVSFDFDGCLNDRKDVKALAGKILATRPDVAVYIITARSNDDTEDLYQVALGLGIPKENVVVTNRQEKSSFINEVKPIWHLDDDTFQLRKIMTLCPDTRAISCIENRNFQEECLSLLDN